ncbi:alanine/glycine:cation symporter family protein [Rhodohalobacter sp. 8-1]|uniref:alanine/glycine:cation symporter family protein n=1 Tax=Rhodohalobacter sp. 8-1 TaxID=3131972 RepID=UPI0030ED49FD
MWGDPLVYLLVGGGVFFALYSRLAPYKYFKHSVELLRGKYDDPDDPGDINHFQALSSALAATVGLGNISGVAVAIFMGGPGALFWMWVSAILGVATKFFTCTLAILYRGKDSRGDIQGGPMYVIMEGLGSKWKPLAILFALGGLFGPLPIFQANQLTQILRDVVYEPAGWEVDGGFFMVNFLTGVVLAGLVSLVIFGGIKRIGHVAARMVPFMVVLYFFSVLYILFIHIADIPSTFALVFTDAFTAKAALGGAVGEIIRTGIQRGAFSNEAGIGTESLAHGAAKTKEPVREGIVAMMGPVIDTIVICTMTALAILVTDVWRGSTDNGITMTLMAFVEVYGPSGAYILVVSVVIFAISSMLTYSYFGTKCLGFLIGAERQHYYNYFYVVTIIFGAVVSIDAVINLIDGMFAIMAIPTMVSALLLSPKVRQATVDYGRRLKSGDFDL